MNATLSHNMKRRPRRGFTLLEVTIAFAVLGLGLIMIAAIFPAALLEHSKTVDRSRALDLATNAETMIHNRVDPRRLYVDNVALASGFDSPWYAIPFFNMDATGPVVIVNGQETSWDNAIYARFDHDSDPTTPDVYPTQVYYSQLNNTPISYFVNLPQLFGVDYLSDTVLPRTAELSAGSTSRMMWQGFYRTMASGTKQYAIAVCKIRQNKQYARQVVSSVDAYANPRILDADLADAANGLLTPAVNNGRTEYPTPWRVTVGRLPNSQILTIPGLTIPNIGTALAKLAPRGAKILIHGRSYTNTGGGVLDFPGGRVLTVVDTDGRDRVQVLEDIGDIEAYDPSGEGFRFDIWVYPPPIVGKRSFQGESPVIEWKVSL